MFSSFADLFSSGYGSGEDAGGEDPPSPVTINDRENADLAVSENLDAQGASVVVVTPAAVAAAPAPTPVAAAMPPPPPPPPPVRPSQFSATPGAPPLQPPPPSPPRVVVVDVKQPRRSPPPPPVPVRRPRNRSASPPPPAAAAVPAINWLTREVHNWLREVTGNVYNLKSADGSHVVFRTDGSRFRETLESMVGGPLLNAIRTAAHKMNIKETDRKQYIEHVLGNVDFQHKTVESTDRQRAFKTHIMLKLDVHKNKTFVPLGRNPHHRYNEAVAKLAAFENGLSQSCGCLKKR